MLVSVDEAIIYSLLKCKFIQFFFLKQFKNVCQAALKSSFFEPAITFE